jgi:uncharacterized damage-inducible protein DinB
MTSDPFQILIRHFHWATAEVIRTCRPLSDAQLDQRFDVGIGSLRGNLDHIIWCVEGWCRRLERGEWIPDGGENDSLDRLQERLDDAVEQVQRLLAEHIDPDGLGETLSFELERPPGNRMRYTYARATIFVHMMTHGVHHRAQCLNMLRRLGAAPDDLPALDATTWQRSTEMLPIPVR